MLAFKSGKAPIPPLQTMSFIDLHNQKSQGFKSSEQEGHASGKYLEVSTNSSALTWRSMILPPSCLNTVVRKHVRSCKAGMINDDKRELKDSLAMTASLYSSFTDFRKEYSRKATW
ncbi:hypothetical protein TNCV_3372291 [Trichonephila clavipes]|nr:hypothetical protein TNCV_3372291 [Trichonephila clavipes]